MTRKMRTPLIVLLLICMSLSVYLIQFRIFGRPGDTGFYFLEDLAFVPVSVLLVTLGVNTVLNRRDRQAMLEKVSIVVNEFFAEAGTEMILGLRGYMDNRDELSEKLQLSAHWQDKDFREATAFLGGHPIVVDVRSNDLYELLSLLENKKDQLLRLFENANLMEHDSFTDMLWAVYHVYDELRSRESLDDLPAADIRHLNIDIQRAAQLLLVEWIDSMRALKIRYPYLYSLAVRKCPFGKGKINVES
ncbi:MAG: hypothetical protein WCG21_04075 [Eubacteriales bacterium]